MGRRRATPLGVSTRRWRGFAASQGRQRTLGKMYSTDEVRNVFKDVPGEPGAVACSRVESRREVSSGAGELHLGSGTLADN